MTVMMFTVMGYPVVGCLTVHDSTRSILPVRRSMFSVMGSPDGRPSSSIGCTRTAWHLILLCS